MSQFNHHDGDLRQAFRYLGYLSVVAALMALNACGQGSDVFTLYRNSTLDETMRIHVATFDADDYGNGSSRYNQQGCTFTATALTERAAAMNDGTAPFHYWCEKGTFRK
ncbi:hypothetical protein [Sphingomonas parapaucimobilis]|uniref:hypothetical protein n=1 Tax=Sphingomonas parapaucimobilis TaxID=28213 RepID=UPI00391C2F03